MINFKSMFATAATLLYLAKPAIQMLTVVAQQRSAPPLQASDVWDILRQSAQGQIPSFLDLHGSPFNYQCNYFLNQIPTSYCVMSNHTVYHSTHDEETPSEDQKQRLHSPDPVIRWRTALTFLVHYPEHAMALKHLLNDHTFMHEHAGCLENMWFLSNYVAKNAIGNFIEQDGDVLRPFIEEMPASGVSQSYKRYALAALSVVSDGRELEDFQTAYELAQRTLR